MRIVMVYPDPKSEKGISAFSSGLVDGIRKQGLNINEITFMQGKPSTLFSKLGNLSGYDIIHLQHEYNLLGFFGLPYFLIFPILSLIKRKKVVTTLHTVISQKEHFRGSRIKTVLRKIFYRVQNEFINLFSVKVIVHSEAFKKILVEEYNFPESKVAVFPLPILENAIITSKQKAKKELNLSGNVYLLIGTMMPDHGHDVILRQADKIGKTILIATNPSVVNHRNQDKITEFLKFNQEIVSQSHFENFVRFDIGPIDNEKWWKYFCASDLVLLPYKGGISSGILADAMAVKTPAVASNIPYFREFAKSYECIRIAEDNPDFPEAIKSSMEPKNYKRMKEGCEKFMKENGLTPISKKYKQFYEVL